MPLGEIWKDCNTSLAPVNVWTADKTKISGTVTLPVGWQIDPTYSSIDSRQRAV
jgi:hypothetical protein